MITPVYIPATRSPPNPGGGLGSSSKSDSGGSWAGGRPCDDEDCYIGSGSGEFNTDDLGSNTGRGTQSLVAI